MSTTFTAQKDERKQVEGHMRVCLSIDDSFESMVSVSASEPLLAEGASYVMRSPKLFPSIPESFKQVLEGFSIHKGDRGELLVLVLLVCARDATVTNKASIAFRLLDFIPQLFVNSETILNATPSTALPSEKDKTFKEIFSDTKLHCNHFIKIHDYATVNRTNLCYLLARGAGVLCANNQRGIDGIMIFTYYDAKLMRRCIGYIIWQVKNDSSYTSNPQPHLFDAMDPFNIGLFDDKDKGTTVPIIRIVFALAAKTPSLKISKHDTQKSSDNYRYTSYDIWCSGLSHTCFLPIEEAKQGVWDALLQASQSWTDVYNVDPFQKQLRQSMNPGAAAANNHWYRWCEKIKGVPVDD